jgi:hypothetical protein
MAEVADIAAFFEEHFAHPGAKPDQETFLPFKRSMTPIEEVKKRATLLIRSRLSNGTNKKVR